jgi:RHS repeat-associated protein
MERLATETRTLIGANNASISKNISYSYNLDGSVKTLTYPSGKIITYTSDAAGRVLSAVDSGSGINYATGSTYGPDGALTGFVSGSGGAAAITNSFSYNKRLQPLAMSATVGAQTVFSINYDFRAGNGTPGSGMDNGNVWGIVNNKDTTRTQTFTYDSLNRLSSAQNSGTDCNVMVLENKKKFWGNNYTYDAWGNLTTKALIQTPIPTCSGENLSVTVGLDNRLGSGYLYDAAGNMTFNATPPTQNYTWDQENRLTGAAGYTYTYDGDGSRVRKSNGNLAANGTLYWYMTPGVVAESDLAGTTKSEYIFFDGGRVARRDGPTGAGGVFYYFSDHLKTASVITDSAGVIKAESDYYPWGGELKYVDNDANDYKFTGKKHDLETRLDYFGARYYANELGRFITPDWAAKAAAVPYADLADPQSLNLYSYVRNRPTVMADADGHTGETPQINGPPVVVDNGNGTSTATQVVQTKNDGKQVTLPNGETGNKITTTTTTYIATFDERNQIVDGSASKQSTITTQTYDSDGKAIGKPKTTTGPVQQLGNNNIKNGLNARDEKAFTSMQAATWHWENVSIGSIAGALSPLVPGYGGKALGMLSGISDIQFYDVSKAMSWGMSQGGWPPKGQYDLNQRTLPYMPLAH